MRQINPEYLAKLVEYEYKRLSVDIILKDDIGLSDEQKNCLLEEKKVLDSFIIDFETKVKIWEGLKSKDILEKDSQGIHTGKVKEG